MPFIPIQSDNLLLKYLFDEKNKEKIDKKEFLELVTQFLKIKELVSK